MVGMRMLSQIEMRCRCRAVICEFQTMANISRTGRWVIVLALLGAAVLVASVVGTVLLNRQENRLDEYAGEWTPGPPQHDVVIRPMESSAVIEAGTVDGHPVNVRCDTCHAGKEPSNTVTSGNQLDEFHQGLKFNHGNGALNCLACHNSENYELLRKPDGSSVPFSRGMELCAQCHGPQYRDYLGGSHGGMTGYWDLQRGGRVRNSCFDCHDPHAPAFGKMIPMPPPKARTGMQSASDHGHGEADSEGERH